MEIIKSLPFQYILPGLVVLLRFFLKLFTNSTPNGVRITIAIYEIPVNALFLSLSFIAAYIISLKENPSIFFTLFIIILLLVIVSILIWRAAEKLLMKKKYFWSIILGFLNFLLGIPILIYSILLLISNNN